MAYGLGLMVPLAIAGTLGRAHGTEALSERAQARLRVVSGASLALAGGFMLSMWTLRATWALFLTERRATDGRLGMIFTCMGCCGVIPTAAVPRRRLARSSARCGVPSEAKLDGHVRLAFTDCLGPCSEPT